MGEIHPAVLGEGGIYGVEGGDSKHLAGAFTVAGGDEGGMGVDEAALVKKFMDSVSGHRPHPEHGVKGIGPGTQIGNRTKKFQRVAFFLERVVGGGSTLQRDLGSVNFIGLFRFRSQNYSACDNDSGAHVEFCDFLKIIYFALFKNDLQIFKGAPVVQFDESQCLAVADRFDPSADGDFFCRVNGKIPIKGGKFQPFHSNPCPFLRGKLLFYASPYLVIRLFLPYLIYFT